MTTHIQLWVPTGAKNPKGKDRPRFNKKTGNVFTPNETRVAERTIMHAWRAAGSHRIADGPVKLVVCVNVVRPKYHFKSDGVSLSKDGLLAWIPWKKKPDVDNVLKLVMDALNKRAYNDDVQVIDGRVVRVWSQQNGYMIELRAVTQASTVAA